MSKKTGDQSAPPDTRSAEKKRHRVDWEAIERDYRTDKFTLRELETKHGVPNSSIARRMRQDREKDDTRWQKDLSEAVRQATNARLMSALVSKTVSDGQQAVSNTVLAAAEVNAQVIQSHRTRATKAVSVALRMLEELDATTTHAADLAELFEKITEDTEGPALALAQQRFNDLMKLHNRVGSVHKLLDALAKAQAMERQSHNITDGESADEKSRRTIPIVFVDAEPQPE